MALKHQYKSLKPDPADATIIGASKWNADHYYVDSAGTPVGNVGAILYAGASGLVTHVNSAAGVLTCAAAGSAPAWAASPTLTALLLPTSVTPSLQFGVAATGFFSPVASQVYLDVSGGTHSWQGAAVYNLSDSAAQYWGVAQDVVLRRQSADTLEMIRSSSTQRLWIGPAAGRLELLSTGAAAVLRTIGAIPLILGTNSANFWNLATTGDLTAIVDNTYDIGASGATRPRSLYVGTSVLLPDGSSSAPSLAFAGDSDTGLRWFSTGRICRVFNTINGWLESATEIRLNSGITVSWSGGDPTATGPDVQLSRGAADRLDLASGDSFNLAGGSVLFAASVSISSGSGTPESVKTAPVGSLFLRTDGGASTTLYVKQSGTGNTGWVAK